MNFTTTISRTVQHAPLDHLAAAADDVELVEDIDLEVEVEFSPGWYTPARLSGPPEDCYPAEGDDPEIEKVIVEETGEDITDSLTDAEYRALVREAWQMQEDQEPDYDPPDDDYYYEGY